MDIKGFLVWIAAKKLPKNARLMPENDKFVQASNARKLGLRLYW